MKPQRRNDVEGFGLARHCAGFSMSAKREFLGAILGQNERENTGKWGGIDLKTYCEKAVKSQVWRAFRAVSAYTMMLLVNTSPILLVTRLLIWLAGTFLTLIGPTSGMKILP